MQSAKIHLSPQQIKLVSNAELILTKNAILHQLKCILEDLHKSQHALLVTMSLPKECTRLAGKISRGENYLGLPWLVLDNPRCFAKDNIYAIRSMVWWGNFFSTTLHLSGNWLQTYKTALVDNFDLLKAHHFLLNIGADEWLHDVSHEDYRSMETMSAKEFEAILQNAVFVKIACHTPIERINEAPEIWLNQFKLLLKAIV